jgi:hypothetical protein
VRRGRRSREEKKERDEEADTPGKQNNTGSVYIIYMHV